MDFTTFMYLLKTNFMQKMTRGNEPILRKRCYIGTNGWTYKWRQATGFFLLSELSFGFSLKTMSVLLKLQILQIPEANSAVFIYWYIRFFFVSNTFVSNARLKLAKNQANAKQNPGAKLLLFENYAHSSSKYNRAYSRK